jgi:hypothetical protein
MDIPSHGHATLTGSDTIPGGHGAGPCRDDGVAALALGTIEETR